MITDLQKLSHQISLGLHTKFLRDFQDFPLLVSKSFVSRIKPHDINDPLLLQILPQKCEYKNIPGYTFDPLREKKYSPLSGLIHKYYGRVLLLVTNRCAINCRFCFRRYLREEVIDWSQVFSYIRRDFTISEVILSGGDPLMLAAKELREIIDNLSNISHVKKIRIHSRIPIVMPERIGSGLFNSQSPLILVIHCNHPNEINLAVKKALNVIRKKNVTIFNQSVLLRNINDDAKILIALSEKLFASGVIPYYLHIMDKVKGATHFYVGIKRAKEVYREMQKKLSGYLVPKLVLEVKGRKKYL
ncbi:MAG: KamA family radical SAM protein [Coxiellaceae bacterium]|jgi:EF-P beta-lysylation protein EpmB|nr:KamA family radical SAM protein [Coxiellaceae bacterium]